MKIVLLLLCISTDALSAQMVSYPYYPWPYYECAPEDKEGEYACFQVNITNCAVTSVNFTFTKVFPSQHERVVTYTLFYGRRRVPDYYAGTIHYCVIADHEQCPDHKEFIAETKRYCPFMLSNFNLFLRKDKEFRRLLDKRRYDINYRGNYNEYFNRTNNRVNYNRTHDNHDGNNNNNNYYYYHHYNKANNYNNVTTPFNTTTIRTTKPRPDEISTLFVPTTGVNESSISPSIEKIRKKLREREASLQRWTSWFLLLLGMSMTAATVTMFLMLKKLRKLVDESTEKVRGSTPGGSARSVNTRKAPETGARKKASSAEKKVKPKPQPKKAAPKQTAPKQPLASPLKDIMQLYDASKDVGGEDEEKNSKKGSDSTSQSPDNPQSLKKVITGPNLLEKQDVMFGGLVHL
ncbi:hypothetical protein Aduo_004600 [Ancylostoma duodenale]